MIGWSYSFQSDFLGTDKKTNKKFKSISGDVNSCSDMILTVSQKWMVHKQTFWRTFIIIRQEFHTKNIKYPNVRILKRLNKIVQNYANRCYRNNLIFFFSLKFNNRRKNMSDINPKIWNVWSFFMNVVNPLNQCGDLKNWFIILRVPCLGL